jgi:pyruvate dehydrogenase E1 component alpha subunit
MNKNLMIKMYKEMVRIRRFEERVLELFSKGKIPGMLHSYIGEEAVAAGACSAINSDDYITSTHRGHGHVIAKGADLKRMMAELFAKSTGYNKGKGGSMHIAEPNIGILGANGIVGGGIPIATGSALSSKILKNNKVTLCFFGDGASNQGTFHESINLASAFNLPCVYICENNLYGVSVKQTQVRKVKDIADRAKGYAIPGVIVDGNDVIAVYRAVMEAVNRAREGEGPTLIECKTYRWRGHYEGDPVNYRTEEELEEWKKKDPIKRFSKKLLSDGMLNKEKLEEIEKEVKKEIDEAVDFADKSPKPDELVALEDVYGD